MQIPLLLFQKLNFPYHAFQDHALKVCISQTSEEIRAPYLGKRFT